MRLFIAIRAPNDVERAIRVLQDDLENSIGRKNVRCGRSGVDHCTVAFLGEVQENKIDNVINTIQHHIRFVTKFEMVSGQLAMLPNPHQPHVIVQEVKVPESVKLFRGKLCEEFKLLGLMSDNKQWYPHLTIGRVRVGAKVFEEDINKLKVLSAAWLVEDIGLYASELTNTGVKHTLIKKYTF